MKNVQVTATAERDGKWWVITAAVPGHRKVHTQARRLSQVEAMTREAVALTFEWPEESITVTVDVALPATYADELANARRLRDEAAETNRKAAEAMRSLTHRLADEGFSLTEIAQTLGVSKTRAQQLAA